MGLDIVLRDKKGKIKQDLHVYRDEIKGKTIEVDTLKEKEGKNKKWMKNKQKKFWMIQRNY